MKCSSKVQAERVALIGAAKMAGADYVAIRSKMNPAVWRIAKPGQAVPYHVETAGPRRGCTCEFYRENRHLGVCKHLIFCEAEGAARDYCEALAERG